MSIFTKSVRKSNTTKYQLNSSLNEQLSILLVEKGVDQKSLLTRSLVDFGYQVIKHSYQNDNIIEQIELYNPPNILILATDLPQ